MSDITPQPIGVIKISGINYPVLSASFSAGNFQTPSSITASLVSESGNYDTLPSPSGTDIRTIQIGQFSMTGFLVRRSLTKTTSGGRVLELKFLDNSIELDRNFVGLLNQMGTSSSGNLIIVGKEVDPCGDVNTVEVLDPCGPCQDDTEASLRTQRYIDCSQNRRTSILNVEYNFSELLSKIPFPFTTPPETDDDYKTQYTGSLRSVLSSWCADYGYTFYWDAGSLRFVDLRKGLEIDHSSVQANTILQTTESVSIENSRTQGASLYFGAEGSNREYDCSGDYGQKLLLSPIRLNDIIDPKRGVMQHYGNFSRLEAMIGLSMYSADLRDNYVWFDKEGILGPNAAESKIASSGEEPSKIALLGNLEITGVYHAGSSDAINLGVYEKLLKSIQGEDPLTDFVNRKAYFFKAKRDDDLLTKYLEFENNLGKNFLGKYFVRRFKSSYDSSSLYWLTPDGESVTYYKRADPFQFDFINDIPDSSTKFTQYLEELTDKDGEAATSFAVLKRNTQWLPSINSLEADSISKDMGSLVYKEFGSSNVSDALKEDERFFIAYPKPNGFDIGAFSEGDHPLELDNVNVPVEFSGYLSTYGLRDAATKGFTVSTSNMRNGVGIIFPPQSLVGSNNSGYVVLMQHSGNITTDLFIEKKEIAHQEGLTHNGSLKFDINFKDETANLTRYLESEGIGKCGFDDETILNELKEETPNFTYETPSDFIEKSFIVNGFPPLVTVSQGLDSFNIRRGIKGIETTLNFSNKHILPIPQSLLNHKFEQSLKTNFRQKGYLSAESQPRPDSIASA